MSKSNETLQEIERRTPAGIALLLAFLILGGLFVWGLVIAVMELDKHGASGGGLTLLILFVLLVALDILMLCGLFTVNPNEAKVLPLFGRSAGTVKTSGLRWSTPFYTKKKISLRVRNFETGKMKVSRASVARFVASAVTNPAYLRKSVSVSGAM